MKSCANGSETTAQAVTGLLDLLPIASKSLISNCRHSSLNVNLSWRPWPLKTGVLMKDKGLVSTLFEHAPDWANWAAMNKDGTWYWYECKPECDPNWEGECWTTREDVCTLCANQPGFMRSWIESLVCRPEVPQPAPKKWSLARLFGF